MSIAGKIETLRRSPLESVKKKFNAVYMRSVLEQWSRLQLWRVGLLGVIDAFHGGRPASSKKPVYADLWFLYTYARLRHPRVIWEFGSGCSTVVFAYALLKNAKDGLSGFMYSIDTDEFWGESTRSLTPSFLLPFYTLVQSGIAPAGDGGGLRHTTLPDVLPDFMYLDGPDHPSFQPTIAVDLLDIEDKLPRDFFLIVDCRRDNTHFLRAHLKRKYKFWRRKFIPQYVFELLL